MKRVKLVLAFMIFFAAFMYPAFIIVFDLFTLATLGYVNWFYWFFSGLGVLLF